MDSSPPLTPIRQYFPALDTSPSAHSYRHSLRRRSSSFSSNHNRSPVTPRSSHRFSNASRYSIGSADLPTPGAEDGGGGGLGRGNLADELEHLDDEYEDVEDANEEDMMNVDCEGGGTGKHLKEPSPIDGARDSGIDVSYGTSRKKSPTRMGNLSKPHYFLGQMPPDEGDVGLEERASPELEDAMNAIARMASHSSTSDDPLLPRTVALLQDLGDQSILENGTHRLVTGTNSLTAYLAGQSRSLASLSTALFSPFYFAAPLDPTEIDDITPLIGTLLKVLPRPETAVLVALQKLERESAGVLQALASLTDTVQMGRQVTNAAARHLRTTQTLLADMRRERERAEVARTELDAGGWDAKVAGRWCAAECRDVVGGFEEVCERMREQLVAAAAA